VNETDRWSLLALDGDDNNGGDDTKTARGWNGTDNDNYQSTQTQKTDALETKQTEKVLMIDSPHWKKLIV
jgi:hypothetical protein